MVENDRVTTIPPRLRPLLDAGSPLQDLAGRLVAGGHQSYLVGGRVRDALLDLSTDEQHDVHAPHVTPPSACRPTRTARSALGPTPAPTRSSGSSGAGRITYGSRASGSARSAA